jgi:hypothetical protein
VKITANTTVMIIPNRVPRRLPSISEWCAYVTLAPDDRSRIVFNNGISKGFNGSIPAGGQCVPSSTVGARAEWKYAQKIEMKKKISLTMNRATPRFRPFCTANVWFPRRVPSVTTSRNHRIIALTVAMNPRVSNTPLLANPLKYIAAAIVSVSNANEVSKGHGDGVTRWNG